MDHLSFDIERTKKFYLSIIYRGFIRFTIIYSDISLLRTPRRTNFFFSLRTETPRFSASRIQISLLIESSLRDIFVYDLLRRDFATPDLAPRTRLEDRILISTTLQRHPTRLTTRKDLDVLEDIFNKPSEKFKSTVVWISPRSRLLSVLSFLSRSTSSLHENLNFFLLLTIWDMDYPRGNTDQNSTRRSSTSKNGHLSSKSYQFRKWTKLMRAQMEKMRRE